MDKPELEEIVFDELIDFFSPNAPYCKTIFSALKRPEVEEIMRFLKSNLAYEPNGSTRPTYPYDKGMFDRKKVIELNDFGHRSVYPYKRDMMRYLSQWGFTPSISAVKMSGALLEAMANYLEARKRCK